ncbi:MAG: MFS transporter [Candidatus Aminicenantes bacterium]|jgi:MFS family permease
MKKMRAGSFKSNIKKMYLMKLLFNMYFYSAIIVPFYTEWGGIQFSRILFLNAWFMFWNFLLEIPTGTVADFLGRKVSLILGCMIGAAGVLIYASYPHLLVFLLAEVILAVSYTLISGADEALVYDSLKEINQTHLSKQVFSRMESLKLTGIVMGAISGGFIAKHLGLRMPMILQAIPLTIAGVLSASLTEPEISPKKTTVTFSAYRKILVDGVRYFWRSKILKMLTLDMVMIFAFAWIIIWFYQALLKNAGVDIAYFGIVHAFMSLSQILIINNFIRLEKWLGSKKRLLSLSAFLTGAFFILLGVTSVAAVVIAGIILCAGFGLSRGPLFSSYMNKYIPSDKRATILSTTSMLRTFSIVIVNSVSGVLADWSIPNTLLILGVATILFSFFSKIKEEDLID